MGRSGSSRPKSVGRCVGRKSGVLYDEYVKYEILNACGFNKTDKSIVLHTQEGHGSSPCAPTIRINDIHDKWLTSYRTRRRSTNLISMESFAYTPSGRIRSIETSAQTLSRASVWTRSASPGLGFGFTPVFSPEPFLNRHLNRTLTWVGK